MDIEEITDEEMIIVGDKVDLVTQGGEIFRTMIEDEQNGILLAGIPSRRGVYMHVKEDDDLYLVFYRDSGRYIAHMKVAALETQGALRYMRLVQNTRVQKNQRRNAFRLQVSFEVQIFEYTEKTYQNLPFAQDNIKFAVLETVNSKDISVTGISLLTKKKYDLDQKYILSLHFSKTSANIKTRAETERTSALYLNAFVKRCIPWRTGNFFNTGMHFFGMTESVSDGIARYVFNEQQRQLKRRNRLM